MSRFGILACLCACDPIWGVHVQLREPATNRPVDDATVAIACPEGATEYGSMVVRSDASGAAQLGGIGSVFPVSCDVFVAKPGFRTRRIRYGDICPAGPSHCDRVFSYDLVLERE